MFDNISQKLDLSSTKGVCILCMVITSCLSTEWSVLTGQFSSLCNTLPHNYQLTIDKLRNMVQIIKDNGEQLSHMITSSTDTGKINNKIITYLIIKLCYSGSDTSLVRLCDVMDELIDPTGTPTCVQQIRHGMHMHVYVYPLDVYCVYLV